MESKDFIPNISFENKKQNWRQIFFLRSINNYQIVNYRSWSLLNACENNKIMLSNTIQA